MQDSLSKNSSVPLYQQLVELIKEQIATGKLKKNDRLPTETELSKAYDVSRITVRKAIEILAEEDILIKRQGIGTFVAEKKLNRVFNKLQSFTQMCHHDGKVPSSELISAELVDASVSEAQNLQISENEKILRIIRVRKCDGEPVMLEENHFSTQYAYLLAGDLTGSVYEILESHGVQMTQSIKTVDICYADEQEAEYLDVEPGSALLLHKDLVSDSEGVPIHFCKILINPARYKLTIVQ